MFKLVLEKAEEPEIKLPTSAGSSKKQESSRKKVQFCFIDYARAFDYVNHNKLWMILKEMGILDHLTCLLRNPYAGQEAIVRTGHETTDCFKSGKEYVKAVYCHPAYLTYMQSMSWEMLNWVKRKLESILPREVWITSHRQMALPLCQKEELKSLLMKVKEESEKPRFKLKIQNAKIWHPVPSLY